MINVPPTRPARIACAVGATSVAFACGRTPVFPGGDDVERPALRCGDDPLDVFATLVLRFDPTAGGGQWPEREDVIDPAATLGPPDYQPDSPDAPGRPLGTVSIGDGGVLAVSFEPCVLVANGTRGVADLYVFEAGSDERVSLAVRPVPQMRTRIEDDNVVDDQGWVQVAAEIDDEGGFDLDTGVRVRGDDPMMYEALQITDVPAEGLETAETPGADIDAFEAVEVVDAD